MHSREHEDNLDSGSDLGRSQTVLIGAVFFVSGTLSLVYQVLWMKELRLLFGNTAHATATTLTAFFLGLALGGWAGGKAAPGLRRPLLAYGVLEILIGLSALLYFLLFGVYAALYPSLYQTLGGHPAVLILAKFLLGVGVLLPASFFMGATLPVLAQHVVRGAHRLGRRGTALYAVNTLGAALGAYLAGFHLPRLFGFDRSYIAAIGLNLILGLGVVVLGRRFAPPPPADAEPGTGAAGALPGPVSWGRIRALAVLTGFVTLGLEVLWTHMFAQVLHNSVYTFSMILISFLTALALGSVVAHVLIRLRTPPRPTVLGLLAAGGILIGLGPVLFNQFTHGLSYHAEGKNWASYQVTVFLLAGGVMFVPTLLVGTVFPYLLKLSEGFTRSPGRTVGRLVAVNTGAAILGSLTAGFLLLEWIGLWPGIRVLAVLVVLGGLIPFPRVIPDRESWRLIPVALFILALAALNIGNPPKVKIDPSASNERLLEVWEGSAGVVGVVQNDHGLRIKVDNHYALGGSGAEDHERRQGLLPLLLHPHPRDVFYLGMGTGITASAAVTTGGVESITICELVPDAVTAAREYFAPYARGLFLDPRTRILAEDGRNFLRATDETFDVITSDLFVPWKAGSGTLYSLEHFQAVRDHLNPEGLFAQWLPLYQISREEFSIIGRTMLEVFPLVTVWRGDFFSDNAIIALVGHRDSTPLDPGSVKVRLGETVEPDLLVPADDLDSALTAFLLGYCGNLTEARNLVEGFPINTDDRPRIEYSSPVTHRRANAKEIRWFTQDRLLDFLYELREAAPPESDPYVSRLSRKERGYLRAGLLVQRGRVERDLEQTDASEATQEELQELLKSLVRM